MPGRPSSRSYSASRLPAKSSVQVLTATRNSTASPTANVPDEGPTSNLRRKLCSTFADAQTTSAGHRKLVASLRKIQETCLYEPPQARISSDQNHATEEDFNVEFVRCVIRLMSVKKGEPAGEKLVRFTCLFLKHASEKDGSPASEAEQEDALTVAETPTSRLVMHVFSILLQFLVSKEKTVRYRATQLVAQVVNALDSIDDEYYHLVRAGLLKRIHDKEVAVRVQAVMGLGRLAGNEDGDARDQSSAEDEDNGLLERLLDVLQNDASAEVRRSLLLNLPLTPNTLPYLLERARDTDSATRRVLYSRLLPALGDFRHLSLSMREKLLRWGLRDRDHNVKRAAARLFSERWIEDCAGSQKQIQNATSDTISPPSVEILSELLERIDVINSGVETGVASQAMNEFWDGRPDYREEIVFSDTFWESITPETAFIARTWNDYHHRREKDEYSDVIEQKMPEVTKLAFFIQRYINNLTEILLSNATLDEGMEGEETIEQEFVVEQMLHIAKSLDYSDEIGRRKTFSLLRESLAIAELPDEITKLSVEVLREICGDDVAGEREFCGVVLEAIAEVHDTITVDDAEHDEGSFHSARSELSNTLPTESRSSRRPGACEKDDDEEGKAIREIMINMKCLHIAQCMLENVEDDLQSNMNLVTMLNNLVVPAVRSHEAPIRERGLICLGLCSLLDKSLAKENLTLFLHCFNKGHETLQVNAIYTLSDILETHPTILTAEDTDIDLQKAVVKLIAKGLKAHQSPDVQTAATTAMCKLMLMSVLGDEDLLKQAVILFFDPATKNNAAMRQSLSYCLPVYCYSKRANMERMAHIAAAVIHAIVDLTEEADEGDDVLSISIVGNLLIDWTDARKLVVHDNAVSGWDEVGQKDPNAVDSDTHLVLAAGVLQRVLDHGCSKSDRKALLGILGKLHVTPCSSTAQLQVTSDFVDEAIDNGIAADAASRTALNKLRVALDKSMCDSMSHNRNVNDETEQPTQVDPCLSSGEDQTVGEPDEGKVRFGQQRNDGSVVEEDSVLEELLDDGE